MLADRDDMVIHADVPTKNDNLYKGMIRDKMLNPDGSLNAIILSSPKRFRREEYMDAKRASLAGTGGAAAPDAKTYWAEIPSKIFILMASEIVSINVNPGSLDASKTFSL